MKTKLKVVKIGSGIIDDPSKLEAFLKDFSELNEPKILVHGGGEKATQFSGQLNIPTNMVNGRRITSAQNLEVVIMVYAGLINKTITSMLQNLNCNAIGLTGADANCIKAQLRPATPVNYGYVGDVTEVNEEVITNFINMGLTPVFCAITHDQNGQLLNTNADTIAAEIAIAMGSKYDTQLLYCFEKPGVMLDVDDEHSTLAELSKNEYQNLVMKNQIFKGMIPKLDNCFNALEKQVKQVGIGNENSIKNTGNYTSIIL